MTLSDDVESVAQSIWDSLLDSAIYAGEEVLLDEDTQVTGSVSIYGEFQGVVLIQCPRTLGARLAAALLHSTETPSEADVRDAFGELANMFAGNLKALLPKPSFISLPTVEFGSQDAQVFADITVVVRVSFVCDGEPLVVTILQRSDPPGP